MRGRAAARPAPLLRSPTWAQIISDVIVREIVAPAVNEAPSRRAALVALKHSGAARSPGAAKILTALKQTFTRRNHEH
jgi:sugar (pentulose or hexulose) kinase